MKVKEFEMLVRKHAGKQAPSFLRKLREVLKEDGKTLSSALKALVREGHLAEDYGAIGNCVHRGTFISLRSWRKLLEVSSGEWPDRKKWFFLYDPSIKL